MPLPNGTVTYQTAAFISSSCRRREAVGNTYQLKSLAGVVVPWESLLGSCYSHKCIGPARNPDPIACRKLKSQVLDLDSFAYLALFVRWFTVLYDDGCLFPESWA